MPGSAGYDLSWLGWDDRFSAAYLPYRAAGRWPARVLTADRGVCTVLGADGITRASVAGTVLAAAVRQPTALPCVGDWVVGRRWPDARSTIDAVLPRRSAIGEPAADRDPVAEVVARDAGGRRSGGQLIAANVDTVAIVQPMYPRPDAGRIARLLIVAAQSGAEPLILLTRCERAADPEATAARVAALAPDVAVLAVSERRGTGLAALRRLVVPGRTLALLGPPGPGRSTLVQAITGATVLAPQPFGGTAGDRAGGSRRTAGTRRHTATFPALVPVPGGGAIVDVPGAWGMRLLDPTPGPARAARVAQPGAQAARVAQPGVQGARVAQPGERARRR